MGDIRPLGSEKLEGVEKLRRIMEIARYNEAPKTETNPLSTTNYSITLADGMTYGIVKEKTGYIIKKGLNESEMDYSEPMKQRKYYRSYSEAMKKLNLVAAEVNRVTGNEFEIPLIGEQEAKKKYVLKTPKPKAEEIPAPEPAMEPAAAPTQSPEPPSDMGSEMGGEEPMGMEPEMGAEEPMGMEPEMGAEEPTDGEEPMGMEPEMGAEEDEDDEPQGPAGLKSIQRLTGKLSQKIRAFDKDQGLDSQDIKYVINSIISAMDLDSLDEDDKEDILSKFDESDEYGAEGEGEFDLSGEDDFDMGMEPEMTEPTDGDEPMGMEPEMTEPVETYTFKESVESVLSNYFVIKEEEKKDLEKKSKKDFLKSKINKIETLQDLKKLSESKTQYNVGLNLIKENNSTKFIGKTNKSNLVFIREGKQIKVTPTGSII